MNSHAPEPTTQDFKDALALTIEEWARRTIGESTNPELAELLVADGQELAKVTLYINDIAPYSGMVAGFPPNLWPWFAT